MFCNFILKMIENVVKCFKMDSGVVVIGIYNGYFYVDEVFVVYMLCKYILIYVNVKLVCICDFKFFDECDIVVDVGGEYEFVCYCYDYY